MIIPCEMKVSASGLLVLIGMLVCGEQRKATFFEPAGFKPRGNVILWFSCHELAQDGVGSHREQSDREGREGSESKGLGEDVIPQHRQNNGCDE